MELFLITTIAELKQIISAGTPVRKPIGNNLYFRLNQYKVASWEFRYVVNGKRRYITIGKLTVKLSKAAKLNLTMLSKILEEKPGKIIESALQLMLEQLKAQVNHK